MKRPLFCINLLVLCIAQLPASVDFYSYQRNVKIQLKRIDSMEYYDTTITFTQRKLGPVQLEISKITVTPQGSYLDIVEDAWISGSVTETNLQNITENFIIKGTLPIPHKAAVTGLLTWKGDTCFKSNLMPSKYNFDVIFLDSISLQQALDSKIALLQQHTETTYEATFARVELGERKHIRIRYLLPNTSSGKGHYSIPVLFHSPASKSPRFVEMIVLADNKRLSYTVETPNGDMPITDSATVSVPYASHVTLKYTPQIASSIHLTAFNEGPMKGEYLLLNTEVDDSLLAQLSKPIKTIFVWRWNAPMQFIDYSNQMKTLSSYAYSVINQASAIRSAVKTLQNRGYQCGLVHSVEGDAVAPFQTRSLNDSGTQQIIDYLSQFDEQTLFTRYSKAPDPLPSWVPREVTAESLIEKARSDFLSHVDYSATLLKDFTDYRHIVLVTTGDPKAPYSKNLKDTLTELLDSVTIDMRFALWRGVDIGASVPAGTDQRIRTYLGFRFPMFFPATVELSISNGQNPYLFPLDGVNPGVFAITARAVEQWDTVFNWKGLDSEGAMTARFSAKPFIFRTENDSGLAKVWAKDESHLAEIEEIFPGGTFGIVTKATFLQATRDNISEMVAQGVPFLTDEEIKVRRTGITSLKKKGVLSGISTRYARGVLCITSATPLSHVEFFDLSGKKLGSVSLARFVTGKGSYSIPVATFLFLKTRKIVLVKIVGASFQKVVKLNIGDYR
ncbi:MAG: hypothetical protein JW768_08020 [Chitinispirillaceae bacterium]|nr:hypothetical protein [Chitinispirillaceae bacterium]